MSLTSANPDNPGHVPKRPGCPYLTDRLTSVMDSPESSELDWTHRPPRTYATELRGGQGRCHRAKGLTGSTAFVHRAATEPTEEERRTKGRVPEGVCPGVLIVAQAIPESGGGPLAVMDRRLPVP